VFRVRAATCTFLLLRVKLFTGIILKYAYVVCRRYTTLSQKKPPLSYVRRNARAFLLFFLSPSLSLSLHPLTLSLSLGFIYVCNQNCPVFAPPSDDIFYSDFIAMVTLTL
jgi:hypothetical protein